MPIRHLRSFPFIVLEISISPQNEASIDRPDYNPELIESQKLISVTSPSFKVSAEPILSTDGWKRDKTMKVLEYSLIPERFTVGIVESADEEIADTIKFDGPYKYCFSKRKPIRFAIQL